MAAGSSLNYFLLIFTSCLYIQIENIPSVSAIKQRHNNETLVAEKLLKSYSKQRSNIYVRPVLEETDTLQVQLAMTLVEIKSLNEESRILESTCWLRYKWTDPYLSWNPENFGSVDVIHLPASEIWKPDIQLYTSAVEYVANRVDVSPLVTVTHRGAVEWTQPRQLQIFCTAKNSSSHVYECTYKFASWVYDGFKLDLELIGSELQIENLARKNEKYVIKNHSAKSDKVYYPCCPEPFPDVQYVLEIQVTTNNNHEKTSTKSAEMSDNTEEFNHVIIIFLPIILLTTLMLLIFCVPSDMDSKINLGMFIFLGYTVLLIAVTFLQPMRLGAHFSEIQWFLVFMLCLVTVCLCIAVLSINIAKKGEAGLVLPECLRKTFNTCLGCLVCVFYNRQRFLRKYSVSDWDKNEQIVANRDWRVFADVLDRCFFFMCLVVIAIAAVATSLYL